MVRTPQPTTWMTIILIACIGMAGIAWQHNPSTSTKQHLKDTLPERNREDKTIINGDIDKAIEEVNRAKENLEKQLQNRDWEKMQRNIEQSLSKIDAEKMQQEIAKAMKQIDMQKIQLQAEATLKKIDWEKIQKEMQHAQEEIKNTDGAKMKKEIQEAMECAKKAMAEMKNVDLQKIQREMEHAKESLEINGSRMKEEMERATKDIRQNMKKDFRKEFEKAREGVDGAIAELQNYKAMLTEMDADGLVKTNEPYTIEYKKGVLIINGKTEPENITNKYKHYFKKEHVKIKKSADDGDQRTIDL